MKYAGGVILLLYAAVTFLGYEPFSAEERSPLPADARRGPDGSFLWFGGFRGGK